MANYTTTFDLVHDALFRAHEPTDGTSDWHEEALTLLNRIYLSICVGGSELDPSVHEDWVWLRKSRPGVLNLNPPITDRTVTVTHASTSVTFSSPPSASSLTSWFLKVTDEPDIYRLAAHTGGAAGATLDAGYTGPDGTGLACTLFQLEYDLATDVLRPISPLRVYRSSAYGDPAYKIHGSDLDTMEGEFPLSALYQGVPSRFAPVGEVTPGTTRIRFNACGGPDSTDLIRVEYDYLFRPTALTFPGTSEEPLIPLQWRFVLSHALLAFLLGQKHDDRATGAFELAQREYAGMVLENRKLLRRTSDKAFTLSPRRPPGRYTATLRTASGLRIA